MGHGRSAGRTGDFYGGGGGGCDSWQIPAHQIAVSSGGDEPASWPPAVGTLGGGYADGAKLAEFYRYAHQNVARVVLRLGSGKQYSAQTFAAWPGSGLRLWDLSVPTDLLRVKPGQDVMMDYDATGQLVWQLRADGSA